MTEASVVIARVDRTNVNLLVDADEDVFDYPIRPAYLEMFLATPGNLLVVAIAGGQVIGQCVAYAQGHVDSPPEAYLDNLGVASAHRRQGIATALIREVFAWAAELGCGGVWIVTDADNDEANGLYRSMGAEKSPAVVYAFDAAQLGANS